MMEIQPLEVENQLALEHVASTEVDSPEWEQNPSEKNGEWQEAGNKDNNGPFF